MSKKASFSLPLLINMVVHHQIFDVSIIFCSLTITHWWYISIFPLIVNRPHLFSKTSSVCREQTSIPERFLRRWWQENLKWLKRECCETFVPIRDQNAKCYTEDEWWHQQKSKTEICDLCELDQKNKNDNERIVLIWWTDNDGQGIVNA